MNSGKDWNDDWLWSNLEYCQSPEQDMARIYGSMIDESDMVTIKKDKTIV